MGNQWTREQQQVIEGRDCSMLVSAAAGSGKTAVLVERIIRMILDETHPVDIDQLLVVTFTNAAAAEMRERILAALEGELLQHPDNVQLQKQVTLVHHAQITTIHSFCLEIIRNHFQSIGLDPGFRIGDEGELKLLSQEVIETLLEEEYQKKEEAYLTFAESFAPGRGDQELESVILQFYHFSTGYPWPEKWMEQCCRAYEAASFEELERSEWMQMLLQMLRQQTADMKEKMGLALALAMDADGPSFYAEALEADQERLEQLAGCEDYQSYGKALAVMERWPALSRKKNPSASEWKKNLVKELRDQVKKGIKKIREDYFYASPEELLADMQGSSGLVKELARLTRRYSAAYSAKKAEKNLVDFNDLEHFALQILVQETKEGLELSETAKEYAQHYAEIMIDEYQDSNLVQEILLQSVSKTYQGGHNTFMVGDVKQSIYRFRLARPELFMEKYRTYTLEEGSHRRIDLHKNFRSRKEVLDGVNLVFYQIMTRMLGGIEYGTDEALYAGAVFEPRDAEANGEGAENDPAEEEQSQPAAPPDFYKPELLLVDLTEDTGQTAKKENPEERESAKQNPAGLPAVERKQGEADEMTEAAESDLRRREAQAVAVRIKEIHAEERVWDKQEKRYRPVRYSDMVILLRTISGWADIFQEVLKENDIPAFTGSGTGYFSALEVKTMLAYLQVLDNPRQDIPLAAVLHSPIGKLTEEELAQIRIYDRQLHRLWHTEADPKGRASDFYTCCRNYLEPELCQEPDRPQEPQQDLDAASVQPYQTEGKSQIPEKNQRLQEKLQNFRTMTEKLRSMVPYTPMHLLLWAIMEETGYLNYAAALPGGAQRKANLDMLVEKAIAYEATSYRGLFHFIRYIEHLQKYEIDYGEASLSTEREDTVRIMSIHKSKGLEFPVVFVSGLGKNFNLQDSRSRLILHPSLGAGVDRVDLQLRVKTPVLVKKVIARVLQEETLGEELRILYVAMTRAKEKLILTGGVRQLAKEVDKWSVPVQEGGKKLSYSYLASCSSYLDWVMPALLRHRCGGEFDREWNLPDPSGEAAKLEGSFCIRLIGEKESRMQKAEEQFEAEWKKTELLQLSLEAVYEEKTRDYLTRVFASAYPYEQNRKIQGKLSVSELKKMSRKEEAPVMTLYPESAQEPQIPRFRQGETVVSGAGRGTIYHRFLENFEFGAEINQKFIKSQLETMVSCGKMQTDEADCISLKQMELFFHSGVGKRMQQAARRGTLCREQPFVLGTGASQIREDWDPAEMVLIQGIIDVYFYEENEIVLLDYKTDYVEPGNGQELIRRYHAQLDYYQMALERLTGKKVKEKIIYSFCLNQEIIV